MSLQTVGGNASLPEFINAHNRAMQELRGREVTEIFKDDAGTRRVLLGKGADGFYGLKVSPAGTDVYTAADDDLAFSSNYNFFKIVQSGTAVVPAFTVASGTTDTEDVTVTFPDQGSRPVVLAFSAVVGQQKTWGGIETYTVSVDSVGNKVDLRQIVFRDMSINSNQVTFTARGYNSTGSDFDVPQSTIKYFVLKETIDT